MQMEPFGLVCVGASDVTSTVNDVEYHVSGAPAATAPAVAGTAVPDLSIPAATDVKPPVNVASPVIVVAGVIVTAPVETEPIPIVPLPSAFIVKFAFPDAWVTTTATVPPVAAPTTLSPVTWEDVAASTEKAGVAPEAAAPTVKAAAAVDWIVVDRKSVV